MWQAPQCILAWIIVFFLWVVKSLHKVEPFYKAYVVDGAIKGGAFTLGPYIFGPKGFRSTGRDHLLVHEYGHTLQSIILGPFYLLVIGLPSILSAAIWPKQHNYRWFEVWANHLSVGFGKRYLDDFESDSFVFAHVSSSYQNPRNKGYNRSSNPLTVAFKWFDALLLIPSFLLVYICYLLII